MNPVFIIAGLTMKEAIRRKVVVAAGLIGLVVAALGFVPLPTPTPSFFAPDVATATLLRSQTFAWVGCGVIKFFSSVLAVTLAAGAITTEIERGVLSTVAPKPLSRVSIYIGKWLGLVTLLACFLAVWGLLLAWDIWYQTKMFHPRMFLGILAVGLFPLLFTTLTLFFSSVAGYALSAGMALIAAGCALAEGAITLFGTLFNAQGLITLAKVVSCIVPISRMNHWITKGLGNAGHDWSAFGRPDMNSAGAAAVATSTADLAYVVVYIVGFLIAGCIVFQRRDL